MSFVPYNVSLPAASSVWIYSPSRDAPASQGWNASYSGSDAWPSSGASDQGAGSFFFRTQSDAARISIDFTGTGLLLCFRSNGAASTLTVDGRTANPAERPNEDACRELGATTTLATDTLDFGSHTVSLAVQASGANQYQFYGGMIRTNIAVDSDATEPTEIDVDDREQAWQMERGGEFGWAAEDDTLAHDSTISFICPYGEGADATYRFTGASAIILYGRPYEDTHAFSVQLDGTTFNTDASVSGWRLGSTPVFFRAGLEPSKSYSLLYSNFNAQVGDCTNNSTRFCCLALDYVNLLGPASALSHLLPTQSSTSATQSGTQTSSASSGPTSTDSSSSTNVGAIAGGAVGGVLGGLLIFFAAFFLWRRHQKKQPTVVAGAPMRQPGSTPGAFATSTDPSLRPFSVAPSSSHAPSSPTTIISGPPLRQGKGQSQPQSVVSPSTHYGTGSTIGSEPSSSHPLSPQHAGGKRGPDALPPAYSR